MALGHVVEVSYHESKRERIKQCYCEAYEQKGNGLPSSESKRMKKSRRR